MCFMCIFFCISFTSGLMTISGLLKGRDLAERAGLAVPLGFWRY